MMYINLATLEYPLTEDDVRKAFPNTSLPATEYFAADGYARVEYTMTPGYNSVTEKLEVAPPERDENGVWRQKWLVVPLPEDVVAQHLAYYRKSKNDSINESRAKANMTNFPFAGKLISCDALSRSDIDAIAQYVALTGEFPPAFPNAWKTVDNSYVPLPDVDAFKAMHAAMVAQGTANFAKAQQLKAQLAEATTFEAIDAIKWE